MNRRVFIELLALTALVALWYHLGPEEPRFAKCVFARAEAKVLSDCEDTSFVLNSLEAQGGGALALDFTQKMLTLFESELKGFKETAPFAKNCSTQNSFYWLKLSSIESLGPEVTLKQAYLSFPETSMNGEELDRRIPILNGGAAADGNLEVAGNSIQPESHRIYLPLLDDCESFDLQVSLDWMEKSVDENRLYSMNPERKAVHLSEVKDGLFEIQTGGLLLTFSLEQRSTQEIADLEKIHQTYSYDNKLILIKDLFNRSMATRLDFHQLVNLNSAFVIDFHNKVLPLFTKGSSEIWSQAVSDFNFTLDSGLLQGAFSNQVSEYYIN